MLSLLESTVYSINYEAVFHGTFSKYLMGLKSLYGHCIVQLLLTDPAMHWDDKAVNSSNSNVIPLLNVPVAYMEGNFAP